MRHKLHKFKNSTENLNSTKYNAESLLLNRELENLIHQQKIRNNKIKKNCQSTKYDPSPSFYRAMKENQQWKKIIDNCEIDMEDGTKNELTNPSEIAGHISLIKKNYLQATNSNSIQTMELKKFCHK